MNNIIKIIFLLLFLLSSNLFSKQLEKVSLQLQWLDQFQFAGYYIAKEKGFYEDVGLDVEIRKYQSSIYPINEVVNQKVTYAIGRSSLIIDKNNGKDIVLISAIFQSSPLVLLATEQSNIHSIRDFIGKRIMNTPDMLFSASIHAMMNSKGVFIDDMIVQKHTFNVEDLINNKTDLMTSYISNEPFLLQKKGIKYKIFNPKDYGFDIYSDILFTSSTELNEHPNRVSKFKYASLRGWKYAFDHIDETIKLIKSKYNIQNKSYEALKYEANILKQLAYYKTKEIGKIDKYKIEKIYDMYNILGFIQNPIDYDKFIFDETQKSKLVFSKEELEYLKNHPVIKVHNEINWPPFNYYENGEAKGYSVDYIKLLFKDLDQKIKFITGPTWNQFMKMLQTPKLDLIINIAKNKQRAKSIVFTTPFHKAQNAIYVNINNQSFNDLDDLKGKTIAMPKGFFTQKFLEKNYPQIKQILVKDSLEALKMLSLGKVDATIGKKVVMDYIIENNMISNVLVSQYIEDERIISHIRIGASKDDKVLIDIVQKLQDNLEYQDIKDLKSKWFGVKSTTQNRKDLKLTQSEKAYLYTKKFLNVCVDNELLPYIAKKDNNIIGISAEFIELYANKLSLNINIIEKNSDTKCDIKAVMGSYMTKNKLFTQSHTYISDSIALVTRMEQPFIQKLSSVNKKVAISNDFKKFSLYIKQKYPNLDIVEVENIDVALKMVANNEIFGYIGTSLVCSNYIQKCFSTKLKIVNSFVKINYGLGINKNDPKLLNIINKTIDSIDAKENKKILNNWIATTVDRKINYKYIIFTILIILIIIVFVVYHSVTTSRNNQILEKRIEQEVEKNRKKDQELFAQQRLAQMGEMISMIAHQWRQPLGAIASTSINLKMKIELDQFDLSKIEDQEKCKEYFSKELDDIDEYVQILTSTINDFRNFYKPDKTISNINVKEPIQRALKIIKSSLEAEDITLVTNYYSTKDIQIYDGEIMHVFLNILKNAQDNFKNKDIEEKQIVITTKDISNNKVEIKICDNGGGISNDILSKIFDPYFSTKNQKNGTGLGLYMSKTIIEEHHNGQLAIQNINNGVCFIIKL
jgi:polar amino acid transport system substrate-binding protein